VLSGCQYLESTPKHDEFCKRRDALQLKFGKDCNKLQVKSDKIQNMIERKSDRRKIERREPKRAVTVRHDDLDFYTPKRIRRGRNLTNVPNPTTSNQDNS